MESLAVVPVVLQSPFWNPNLAFMISMTCGFHLVSSVGLCIFIFLNLLSHNCLGAEVVGSPPDVEGHLELGQHFLAMGQYSDALAQYHAAVDGDPKNYMTYFKRATVYLALGRSKSALKDLNKVVSLKPDFVHARLQRGNVYLKQGNLDEAHIDFEWILRVDPLNPEANRNYGIVEPLKQDLQMAQIFVDDKNYLPAIEIITKILQECPWNTELRELRAECFEAVGDINNAINDLRPIVKLSPDNTGGFLKLSKLYYKFGEAEESLNTIRECLKLDPDHKDCFSHYKVIKKIVAALKSMQELANDGSYIECADKGESTLKLVTDSKPVQIFVQSRVCHCLSKGGESMKAIRVCTEALKLNPEDTNILCDRAEAHIVAEQFDEALHDFKQAAQIDEQSQRAHEGMKKAQKLHKQSKKRNYYQILGVKRTATKREITKAYRKLASQWHPDNFHEGDEKKTAEKKFIDIAAAKEVLTNTEKRQQFDNGDDPLDPESQAGQQFNPFASGFNPFDHTGGGPFTFKFHFN